MEILEYGPCTPVPHDLENGRFRLQSEGRLEKLSKGSFTKHQVSIVKKNGHVVYAVNFIGTQCAVGTLVKVFYDKKLGRYFIGNLYLSDDDIIKEYFEYLADTKYFYFLFIFLITIVGYFLFPFLYAFFEHTTGFWEVLLFILVVLTLIIFVSCLSTKICMKLAIYMSSRCEKIYENGDMN